MIKEHIPTTPPAAFRLPFPPSPTMPRSADTSPIRATLSSPVTSLITPRRCAAGVRHLVSGRRPGAGRQTPSVPAAAAGTACLPLCACQSSGSVA